MTVAELNKLYEQRAKLITEIQQESSASEERALKGESISDSLEAMAKREADVDNLDKLIATRKRLIEEETRGLELATIAPSQPTLESREMAFRNWMTSGVIGAEVRAYQADDGAGGGFVLPQQMQGSFIDKKKDLVFLRRLATVVSVPNADSLGIPVLDTDASDTDWTTELLTGNEETTLKIGKREWKPSPVAKRVKISNTLLRKAPNALAIVLDQLSYKHGVTEEKAFLTGNGVNKPLGLFTASSLGISTSRDFSTGNTTTAFTYAGLMEAKYGVKQQYRANGQWLLHRDGVKKAKLLQDGDNSYIFKPANNMKELDTLDGHAIYESEYVPNTFTTGQYVGMFGDFSYYYIADALGMTMQRLTELYAETNQTGFILRAEADGMPTYEEPFARVKLS